MNSPVNEDGLDGVVRFGGGLEMGRVCWCEVCSELCMRYLKFVSPKAPARISIYRVMFVQHDYLDSELEL